MWNFYKATLDFIIKKTRYNYFCSCSLLVLINQSNLMWMTSICFAPVRRNFSFKNFHDPNRETFNKSHNCHKHYIFPLFDTYKSVCKCAFDSRRRSWTATLKKCNKVDNNNSKREENQQPSQQEKNELKRTFHKIKLCIQNMYYSVYTFQVVWCAISA